MFSKILKKSQTPAGVIPEMPSEMTAEAAWESRLEAAMGDDTALLALAIDAPSIDHKLSSVQALVSEEGLRAAEREFRKHDRRVHSLAKLRYEALVKQRETRAAAAELIQAAAALLEAPIIPSNRLVELAQAWALLDHAFIEDEHKSRFAGLQADLAELIRERGEHKRDANRWSATATQALEAMNLAFAGMTVDSYGLQELAAMLAAAGEKSRTVLASMPATTGSPLAEDDAIAALGAAIRSVLQDAALIEIRLAILGELEAGQAAQHETPDDGKQGAIPPANQAAAIERWKAQPPISDRRIENALNTRYEACLHQRDKASNKQQKQSSLIASEKKKVARQANLQILAAAADAVEAALAAGHLADAGKQLTVLQTASGKEGIGTALQTRIGALQAEFLRLKGWQHWGGGRVRDDLVLEAEALAASTLTPEGSPPVKLALKQLDGSIEQLRARWKELDRLGGATSKTLWQRFDSALKTAHLPVAAHLDQMKEMRQANLAARKSLLAALDALDITADEQNAPDWKEIQRALAHFKTEWRKLGPVEHTVSRKAQQALLERMQTSTARLEDPLKKVQDGAQTERKQFIDRARALGQDVRSRDLMAKLRELQSEWQSHAKSQPLPRKIENKLWAEFKAATGALMNQREELFSARDAGFKANQTAREALIAKLEALHQDLPAADIKRLLASVDTEWRKIGEAPRNQIARLESSYRAAREQAQKYIAGSAQRSWQLTCETLLAKLALCEALESAVPSACSTDDAGARWDALPALPACWEQALQARYTSGGESAAKNAEALDQLLLQLEFTLEIQSPAAFQAARQALKFQALKNAMEGRRSAAPAWPDIEKMTAAAIGYTQPSPDQLSRLQSIIAALRGTVPGSL